IGIREAAVLAALVLATVTAAGCRVQPEERGEAEARARETGWRGIVLPDAPPRPAFTLTDTHGRPYDFAAETAGYATFLFFGYTSCPDVCPVHLAGLAAARRELDTATRRGMKVVFVSVDPERDTPERIRAWLDQFDSDFVGLRGTKAEVDSIQLSLGLPPSVYEPPDDSGFYIVGHASQVIGFAPDGSLRVLYPFGTRQADWKHDIPKLVRLAGGD
ncbi:MAG: SCO family protein, partial [Gemmatimonadota bacterium]|nr:SCO family protein [Gemmatimonadota bacterium]